MNNTWPLPLRLSQATEKMSCKLEEKKKKMNGQFTEEKTVNDQEDTKLVENKSTVRYYVTSIKL